MLENPPAKLEWYVVEKLKALEIVALWTGRWNLTDLITRYGITRMQASRDVARYLKDIGPGNLEYDKKKKAYIAQPDFSPQLIQGNMIEFLDYLTHTKIPGVELITNAYGVLKRVDPKIFAILLQAIRETRATTVKMATERNPKGETITLLPHTLVFTGQWQVRAYDANAKAFSFYPLSRLRKATLGDRHSIDKKADKEWISAIALEIGPNPRLDDDAQRLIIEEYGIRTKTITLKPRVCLAREVLNNYHISLNPNALAPENYPLVLLNAKEVSPYLMGDNYRVVR